MRNETIYSIDFVKVPKTTGQIDQNRIVASREVKSDDGNEAEIRDNSLQGTISQAVEKRIYDSGFRTSKYNTFLDKMNAATSHQDLSMWPSATWPSLPIG